MSEKPSKETMEQWSNDHNNWKFFGLFYYNPQDKRIFPPKRFAWMGWTVNFANTKSVLVFLIMIIAIIILLQILPDHS